MQAKRLFVLVALTTCALTAVLGVVRLAQAKNIPLATRPVFSLRLPAAPLASDQMTVTLESSRPISFYDPGPVQADRTVFFNGEQVISVTADISASHPISVFEATQAFGFSPVPVLMEPWVITYPVGAGAELEPAVRFSTTMTDGLELVRLITFSSDVTAPAGLVAAPGVRNISFTVSMTGSDADSGVAQTALWARVPGAGDWQLAGPVSAMLTQSVLFSPTVEGVYSFGVVITDRVGNASAMPPLTQATTLYDRTAPQAVANSPALATSSPISVQYDCTDTLSGIAGVTLWARPAGSAVWEPTGSSHSFPSWPATVSGAFLYLPEAPGRIYFAAVAVDQAGNRVITPTAFGDVGVLFDPDPPVLDAIIAASDRPAWFYDPGLSAEGGDLYFNGLESQTVTLTVDWTDASPAGLLAEPAFGITPSQVVTVPWVVSYAIEAGASSEPGVRLLISDTGGLTESAVISFVRDIAAPVGSVSAPPFAVGPITVDVTADDGAGSGLAGVELWYLPPGGPAWQPSGLLTDALSASLIFDPPDGEGVYYFSPVVTDRVGNLSASPQLTTAARTHYDITAPESTLQGDIFTTTSQVALSFSATDSSGIDRVTLWVQLPAASTWTSTGLSWTGEPGPTAIDGTFNYLPVAGDGLYRFATRARDAAGNEESLPTTADVSVLFDSLSPASVATAPGVVTEGPITVTWNASDAASGISLVTLWASMPPAQTWLPTLLTSSQESGVFLFTPAAEGYYRFATVSEDGAGNVEQLPAGDGDTGTLYDISPPQLSNEGINEASDYLHAEGMTLFYGNDMSGLEGFYVTGQATDTVSGLDRATFSPAFDTVPVDDLTPASWEGRYIVSNADSGDGQITVRVYDQAGLSATSVFTYQRDIVAPTSGLGSIPSLTNDLLVAFPWQAGDDRSGVAATELWLRSEGGTWGATGLVLPGTAGNFMFALPSEGRHYLATVAVDRVGNRQVDPTGDGDGVLLYDRTPPDSAGASVWATRNSPITVTWAVTDALSEVVLTELWVRVGVDGSWTRTQSESAALSGTFAYTPTTEARYDFATIAQDRAGNRETLPAGSGDSATIYDLTGPSSVLTTSALVDSPSFSVRWAAEDPGEGVGLDPAGAFWVAYRQDGGDWTPWLTATNHLSATFGPSTPVPVLQGVDYDFQVRARDALGNWGEPVSATVRVSHVRIFLPLTVNRLSAFNGDFESGWAGWTHGGVLATSLVDAPVHGGVQAAMLGDPTYGCQNGVPIGSAWVETHLTVPESGTPAIRLWYNMWSEDKFDILDPFRFDGLQIEIKDLDTPYTPIAVTGLQDGPAGCGPDYPVANSGWRALDGPIPLQYWGKDITLRIALYNRPDMYYNTWTIIDDVGVISLSAQSASSHRSALEEYGHATVK